MPSAWDMDGSWKAYPLTVLVERQTLWITASYENWAATLKWGTTQCETEAQREFSRDVHTESTFLPINENGCERKVNTADNARLDISARGLWNSCEKTFFNIWITHPTSQSYSGKSLAKIYRYQQHEKEKKDKYNQRVIDIEKSSFNPLVFTTSGGMAPESTRVNKRLAEKIAKERRQP